MTAAPRARLPAGSRAPLVMATVGGAAVLRSALGGAAPAASAPAAAAFCALIAGLLLAARWRPGAPTWVSLCTGIAGAAVLVAVSLVGLPQLTLGPRAGAAALAWWLPLVVTVAALEELALRGILIDALTASHGVAVAVAVSAVLFAVIHVPLYGVRAVPLDLCVGLFLGSLRVASGSVWAPLTAHALADVATGWVG